MTQEEEQLLLKTLCAMLPYGIQAQVYGHVNPLQILGITKLHKGTWAWKKGSYVVSFWNDTCSIEAIKPYLRPMSSMTEDEEIESLNFAWEDDYGRLASYNENIPKYIDWLNSHHFDYRGLISMGLALESPDGMYKTE